MSAFAVAAANADVDTIQAMLASNRFDAQAEVEAFGIMQKPASQKLFETLEEVRDAMCCLSCRVVLLSC